MTPQADAGAKTMAVAQTWNATELIDLDRQHMLHPVSNLAAVERDGATVITRGEGVYVWDATGRRYIDGFSGLWNVNIGHGRSELAEAAAAQIRDLDFAPTFFGLSNPPAIELAAKLARLFPEPINTFQFTSGGAESNETALKIARYYWWLKGQGEKITILSRKMGYHGIAMGALAATGIPAYHEGFGPQVPGFVHLTAPYAYRNGEGMSEGEFVAMLVAELEETIAREGAHTIAAMIGEPVQGAGGVVVPPEKYWAAITPVLKAHDILLIFDEVICGFGRTGSMFGMQTYGQSCDLVSFAKGITSGYIPLGGVGMSDEIAETLKAADRMFMHGFTYSGHPVACATALPNIRIIEEEKLPANATWAGDYLLAKLHELDSHPHVGNVRGKGLMLLVEIVADKETKAKTDPAFNLGGKITAATRKRGLIVRGTNDGIAIAPPLIVTQQHLDEIAAAIAESIDEVMG
jgi:adenosylmethionine-8-amino-7-oxononanoate aminotransferase